MMTTYLYLTKPVQLVSVKASDTYAVLKDYKGQLYSYGDGLPGSEHQ